MTQSSYLMSFIHGLMENSSIEVRERKRRQLERTFRETEEKLNIHLREKYEDVTKILYVYRDVSQNLEANRNAVKKMKRDIAQCKSLLSCNREELRRLWLELIEQRRSLELIDVLDRVRMAPEILKSLIAIKAWPEATEFSLYITNIITTEVDHVPALEPVKTELATQKRLLVEEMRATLFYLVFNQPLALVIHNRQVNAEPTTNGFSADVTSDINFSSGDVNNGEQAGRIPFTALPFYDWRQLPCEPPTVDPNLFKDPKSVVATLVAKSGAGKELRKTNQQQARQLILANIYMQQSVGDKALMGDRHLVIDKKEWADTIVALTHCLHRLQKLTQPFSGWRVKTDSGISIGSQNPNKAGGRSNKYSHNTFLTLNQGLVAEVHNAIVLPAVTEIEHRFSMRGESQLLSTLVDATYLTELLQLVFPALFMHFGALMLVIRTTQHIKALNPSVNFDFLGMLNEECIWDYIQHEVQLVLSSHLDNNTSANSANPSAISISGSTFNPRKLDLNALMGKKKTMHNFMFSSSSGSGSASGGANATSGAGSAPDASNSADGQGAAGTNDQNSFFSFSKTSHSLSVNSYLRENRLNMPFDLPEGVRGKHINADGSVSSSVTAAAINTVNYVPVVCKPAFGNVKAVYSLVIAFAKVIEEQPTTSGQVLDQALSPVKQGASPRDGSKSAITTSITEGLKGTLIAMGAPRFIPKTLNTQSRLRAFLINFIEKLYLPNAQITLKQPIVEALKVDPINTIISQQTQRELGLNRPILEVCYMANQSLGEVSRMATALPEFTEQCSRIAATLLRTITEWASKAYRNLSCGSPGAPMIPSAEWALDSDLSRFWKNFPVWQRMATFDAYASATTAHLINGEHFGQRKTNSASVYKDSQSTGSSGPGGLSSATATVLGLSSISMAGARIDGSGGTMGLTGATGLQMVPFAKVNSMASAKHASNPSCKTHEALIHEREATRLAVQEMDQLLHMIRNEVRSNNEQALPTAQLHSVKGLGRLHESLHWLVRCVRAWTQWLSNNDSKVDTTRFAKLCEDLTDLYDACILVVYLDVRVHAYNLFGNLPRSTTYWCPVDEVDVDTAVTNCLVYWEQLQEVLIHSFSQHKFRFIFDGLGDFVSQLYLRIIPQIIRMNANGNMKMCRNIYKLQQALALLTENHESDLIRVKQLYELFYLTPEEVVNRVIEQGAAFEANVYQDLLRLYQRSHPSYEFARTTECITKLDHVITRRTT